MLRYQVLLKEAVESGGGMRTLARALDIPVQSLSNYLQEGTEPRLANLEKIAEYFGEPISALLMDFGKESSVENQILEEMTKLSKMKKKLVLDFMRELK